MSKSSLDLSAFKVPLGRLAALEQFQTREGDLLSYRFYPAWSDNLIVLFHGAGGDSRYMCVLASALAEQGIASVVTPDFRGHGASFAASDQITSSQLETDLEELLIHLKMNRAVSQIALAGHSMGGGFVLRLAVSDLRRQFSKFVAIAPLLPETATPNYGGWITVENGGFRVNFPEWMRTGKEKLNYSQAYFAAVSAGISLSQLKEQLLALHPPLIAVVGAYDEVFDASKQQDFFSQVSVPVTVLEKANHLSVVSDVNSYLSLF